MRRLGSALAVITLAAAACGEGEPVAETADRGSSATSTVELTAKNTTFDQSRLTAPAGRVTIRFHNQDDGITHNLHLTGGGVDDRTEIEIGPTTQTLQLELARNRYSYVCDVHPQQMTGELTVT